MTNTLETPVCILCQIRHALTSIRNWSGRNSRYTQPQPQDLQIVDTGFSINTNISNIDKCSICQSLTGGGSPGRFEFCTRPT